MNHWGLPIAFYNHFPAISVDKEVKERNPDFSGDEAFAMTGSFTPSRKALEKNQKGEEEMKKYTCTICGYVYDPAVGDSENGIKPGTAFEKLPDSWTCPVCGASKSDFSPEG